MTLLEHLRISKRLNDLIRRKATGTPAQLAHRLGISRATLYRFIRDFKELGAPIKYCTTRQTYYYETFFELDLEKIC